jgi:hypothetical protein
MKIKIYLLIIQNKIQQSLKTFYSSCCSLGLKPVSFETEEKFKCVHALLSEFVILKESLMPSITNIQSYPNSQQEL